MHVIQKSESKVNFSVASLISTSVPLLCGVKGPSCQLSNIARGSHSKALEGRGGVEGGLSASRPSSASPSSTLSLKLASDRLSFPFRIKSPSRRLKVTVATQAQRAEKCRC